MILQAYRDADLKSRLTVKNNICFAGKVQSSFLLLQGYNCSAKLLRYAVCKIKGTICKLIFAYFLEDIKI